MEPRVIRSIDWLHNWDFLLAVSPIVIREGCYPVRIVLYRKPGKFVVHEEVLKGVQDEKDDTGTGCVFEHHAFDHGDYFDHKTERVTHLPDESEMLKKAHARFKEREARLLGHPRFSLDHLQVDKLSHILDDLKVSEGEMNGTYDAAVESLREIVSHLQSKKG